MPSCAVRPASWAPEPERGAPAGHLPVIASGISAFSAARVPQSEHVINRVAKGVRRPRPARANTGDPEETQPAARKRRVCLPGGRVAGLPLAAVSTSAAAALDPLPASSRGAAGHSRSPTVGPVPAAPPTWLLAKGSLHKGVTRGLHAWLCCHYLGIFKNFWTRAPAKRVASPGFRGQLRPGFSAAAPPRPAALRAPVPLRGARGLPRRPWPSPAAAEVLRLPLPFLPPTQACDSAS